MARGCPSGVRRIACLCHRGLVQIALGKDGIAGAPCIGIPAREYPVLSTEQRKCWVWRNAEADIGFEMRFGSYRPFAALQRPPYERAGIGRAVLG